MFMLNIKITSAFNFIKVSNLYKKTTYRSLINQLIYFKDITYFYKRLGSRRIAVISNNTSLVFIDIHLLNLFQRSSHSC